MKREERRRADALDRFWDATQRGEAPMRPSEVDEVAATVVDHLGRKPASPDIHAAQFRVRQRIVAAANTTEETMHTSALPPPNVGRIAQPSQVQPWPITGHRRETFTHLGLVALLLLTLAAGYARFGPPRSNDGGQGSIPAVVLAPEDATPTEEATPYPSKDHVIIGVWELNWATCVAGTPSSRMIFDPDGSFVEYDSDRGVGIGQWRPTGERTVEVVAIFQNYNSIESMFGVAENLPLPESFEQDGIQVVSYTLEVDEAGMIFAAEGFYEPRAADGSVVVHFEYKPDCPNGLPGYRMATLENAGTGTPTAAAPFVASGTDHIIVGAWQVDYTLCSGPAATPSRKIFDPDGTFVEYDDVGGVGIGMWRATGEQTVEVVAIYQHYESIESMFGVAENLPLPESFEIAGYGGMNVVSNTVEVDATGWSLMTRGFYEPRNADGSVLVHLALNDECGFEQPAYRMATVEKPAP